MAIEFAPLIPWPDLAVMVLLAVLLAGISLLFLLAGGALAMFWFGRMP